MKVIVTKNYAESCKFVADHIVNLVNKDPKVKLGLATGGTAEPIYTEIVKLYNEKKVDFSQVTTVNLDEYVGAKPDNEISYRYYMNHWLFDHINIDKNNTYVANGLNNIDDEIKLFNEKLYGDKQVAFQLLGVGVSGHIGFNESGDKLTAGVHIEDLQQSTIDANARYFDSPDDVPRKAFTMGVGDIMRAKSVLLIATGDSKINVMREILTNDSVTTKVPATLLKLHADSTVVVDEDLARKCGYLK